jgi:hypothetical protein
MNKIKLGPRAPGYFHGVVHNEEYKVFSLRIPKSACSTMRKILLVNTTEETERRDWKNDKIQSTSTYEIFEDLAFEDSLEFFNDPAIESHPMLIFVRDPLERLCSALSETLKVFSPIPNDPNNTCGQYLREYRDKIYHLERLYDHRPLAFENQFRESATSSSSLSDFLVSLNLSKGLEYFNGDNHYAPQGTWIRPLQQVKTNVVYFEVNDYLMDNLNHWMRTHNTNKKMAYEPKYNKENSSRTNFWQQFVNSQLKVYLMDTKLNHTFRNDAISLYQEDIDLYNELKPQFYQGGQKRAIEYGDMVCKSASVIGSLIDNPSLSNVRPNLL